MLKKDDNDIGDIICYGFIAIIMFAVLFERQADKKAYDLKYSRDYAKTHRKEKAEHQREYRKRKPEIVREANKRYREKHKK